MTLKLSEPPASHHSFIMSAIVAGAPKKARPDQHQALRGGS
ncbi:hypothetical protein [Aquamicrobium defluvii]|nr:hypothetical protein [Aquamicrobium defluvii]